VFRDPSGGLLAQGFSSLTDSEQAMKFLATAACLLAAWPAAADERWILSTEAPVAVPVSAAQRDRFGIGGMPALAVYRSLAPWMLVGGRLRAGALSDGAPPPAGQADPKLGGFGSASLALRFRLDDDVRRGTGPWIELAAGVGLTGHDVRPTWETGIGWGFAVGSIDVGPSLRLLRVESDSGPMNPGAATLGLLGIEVTFLDGAKRPPHVLAALTPTPMPTPPPLAPAAPLPSVAAPDPEPATPADRDGDGIPDADDACPDQPETMNGVEDQDGCPDEGAFVVQNDRIVLEERVLFDLNRARVKHSGRSVLRAIMTLFAQHPDWSHLVIEGHADARGKDTWNDWLSQTRAERVKTAMESLGLAADRVEAVGQGSHHPRDPGTTAAAYQRNRRVEFVIVREDRP
jgi:outer membrane protein OmpA-like peptidoglycan-associated protein